MALSARPKTVEQGEWVAHQSRLSQRRRSCYHQRLTDTAVEHYRNLWNFVRVIHEKEEDGSSICNHSTCPKMSAGRYVAVDMAVDLNADSKQKPHVHLAEQKQRAH
jgi:hypothetical protein